MELKFPIDSSFAILDVKKHRAKLAKLVEAGAKIPVMINATINNVGSRDDGTSIEFGMTVHSVAVAGFVKLVDVKAGTKLVTDGGFPCMRKGEHKTVHQDKKRKPHFSRAEILYIDCDDGRHYLDGQLEKGELVGLYHETKNVLYFG